MPNLYIRSINRPDFVLICASTRPLSLSLAESDENGEVRISPDEVPDTFEIDGLNISQVKKGKAYLPLTKII